MKTLTSGDGVVHRWAMGDSLAYCGQDIDAPREGPAAITCEGCKQGFRRIEAMAPRRLRDRRAQAAVNGPTEAGDDRG